MARQQYFDWFMSQQRRRAALPKRQKRVLRRSFFETLEPRKLLSASPGQSFDDAGLETVTVDVVQSAPKPDGLWFVPEGESPPENWLEHDHDGDGVADHAPAEHNHDPGCCCEACTGGVGGGGHEPGCCCEACTGEVSANSGGGPQNFDAVIAWPDQDLNEEGIQLTYSYSNFFDGGMGELTEEELRAATEEALFLWSTYAPLHFIEVIDSGPLPDDADSQYPAEDHPNIRIGHHFIDGDAGANVLAHAYFPIDTENSGLAGDSHFDNGNTWGIGTDSGEIDVIEVMTHEIGHSLGLGHEFELDAIMNPFYGERFAASGEGFLLPDDINGIRALYGEGVGSVTSLMPSFVPFRVNTLEDVDDLVEMVDPETDEPFLEDLSPETISFREAIRRSAFRDGRLRITFDEAVFVTPGIMQSIDLDPALGPLVIPTMMDIEGPGSDLLTLQAPDASPTAGDGERIFEIMFEDPDELGIMVDVSLGGFTLSGGDSPDNGGAIYSSENLTLFDLQADGNQSQGSGGTLYATGPVNLSSSAFENSSAQVHGGAIYVTNDLAVYSSTLSGNQAVEEGGAIMLAGEGTDFLVQNTTISTNTAGGVGGGVNLFDLNPFRMRALHSTIYNNESGETGGGIYLINGTIVLDHTIVAGNRATNNSGASPSSIGPDIDSINGIGNPNVLANYSLVQDTTQANISELTGNLLNADPLLNPNLSDNGGPTKTHVLMLGSPALDAGDEDIPLAPEFDQRGMGFDRIESDIIDMGAVEANGFNQLYTVDTLEDENDGDYSTGDLSLREAVALANASLGPDSINFSLNLSGGTIQLDASLGELLITDAAAIDASELVFGLRIDASQVGAAEMILPGHRVFRVDDGDAANLIDFSIEGLELRGGNPTGDGGAIHSLENLALYSVSIMDNTADGDGGGVYHRNGSLMIDQSTFAGNTTLNDGDGGGLWNNNDEEEPNTGLVRNSTFSGNDAADEGGGIFNDNGLLTLEHVTITNNNAEVGGGVVSFGDLATTTEVYSSIIALNTLNDPSGLGFDVQRSRQTPVQANTFLSLGYNLIGSGNAFLNFSSDETNEVNVTAEQLRLGPLADNGGRTMTHMPLAGSIAIDASDPNAILPSQETGEEEEDVKIVTEYDQRGTPYSRIVAGQLDGTARMDIGAVEVPTPEPTGDFDEDGDTDGVDFLAWQRGYGKTDAQRSDGDSNFDGIVDGVDLQNWQIDYGEGGPLPSHGLSDSAIDDVQVHVATPTAVDEPVASLSTADVRDIAGFAASQQDSSRDNEQSDEPAVGYASSGLYESGTAGHDIDHQGGRTLRATYRNQLAEIALEAETSEESLDLAFESLGRGLI